MNGFMREEESKVMISKRKHRLGVRISFIVVFTLCAQWAAAQHVGISTNLLYWATTTPNVGLEFRTGKHSTFGASIGYNPFKLPNHTNTESISVNPKLMHWCISPEWRYWCCRPFERFYFGLHAIGGMYNMGGIRLSRELEQYRFRGWAAGGGIGIGYQWALGRRWGLNLAVGVGYIYLNYDKYECGACGDFTGAFERHYIGPTRAELSFVFLID